MPIKDYKKVAKVTEERFFKRKDVSKTNKEYVRKFLTSYDVSPSTLSIFLKHIYFLLRNSKDIKKDMQDQDKINKLFKELRDKLSVSYYATIVKVSKLFVRKLNGKTLPEGFEDVSGVSKAKQKRKLNPKDMILWEEGMKLAKATPSVQMKAIVLAQLDGGFRPSEFIDLNYGDVEQKKDFIVANIKDGKTGARPVILFKSVPYLIRWLKLHPTQNPNDPLWISERDNIKRYKYPAVAKRVRLLGEKINLDKPLDFYNFRHSACVLAKKDNVPLEEAAKKFGHSVKYFTETYGRLSTEDSIERLSLHYGIQKDKTKRELNVACKCGYVNEPKSDVCEQCGNALSLKKALELDKGKDKEMTELKQQQQQQKKMLEEIKELLVKGATPKGVKEELKRRGLK